MEPLSPAELDRFWSKVNKNGPIPAHRPELGPCWIWSSATDRKGYGHFFLHGKNELAHRVAWLIATGEWPQDCALHHCDIPACVRYDGHLFDGTNADNMADRDAKGRLDDRRGAANNRAKLTEAQVAEIRALRGSRTQQSLADEFGVCQSHISVIQRGRRWSNV